MSEVIARPVLKNKFWIVESAGVKTATIQACDEGGVVYVHNAGRERFPSIRLLQKRYNIKFVKSEASVVDDPKTDVLGYPADGEVFNEMLEVQRKLPIYTREAKSRSYFCAGYYVVNQNTEWNVQHCPKLITLNRHKYAGPFMTEYEAQLALSQHHD
jgi:hypothetical protein